VLASPERLTQVFENLLDNAVSFSPEGGRVNIAISEQGEAAIIRYQDEGPGIPEEQEERIFDRFVSLRTGGAATSKVTYGRRDESSKEEHLGLGLSIVKTIVDGYGGSVSALNRSDGETGACFEVTLPMV
jgi:two-component system sensor histidine kinase ChvG